MQFNFLSKNIIPQNIVIKKAKGIKLWDINNKEYIDFSSQTLNLNLGNSPDLVKKAFIEQFDKFIFLSTRFTSPVLIDLAKKLNDLSPIKPCRINLKLTNGSDANESAFKRVRKYKDKPNIVTFYLSHVGESSEALMANGKHFKRKLYSGSNNFIHIRTPFDFQKHGYSLKESEDIVLDELEYLFKKRDDIAGFILEPIMVNAGGYIFSKRFLREARNLCTKFDISLIYDEIQTAFGWLGRFFAADYFGVTPDIITLGKALSAGFPLAAILMKEKYDVLDYGQDEYTYGGHPISCAVALENIKYLEESNILDSVNKKSTTLKNLLNNLKNKYSKKIREIRICGLIASIEFINKQLALKVYSQALRQGLILRKSQDGEEPSLVLKPPIIVTENEIKKAILLLSKSITNIIS